MNIKLETPIQDVIMEKLNEFLKQLHVKFALNIQNRKIIINIFSQMKW